MRGVKFASPTLVIVGRVAALHEEFQWVENSRSGQNYFKPVRERMEQQFTALC
jgi:hypothetical protein